MINKTFQGAINIELEGTEYIVEFQAYAYVPGSFSDPPEGGDWEITDVHYANEDRFHQMFDHVPDAIWQPLEVKYQYDLTRSIEDRIGEAND